MAVHVCFLGIDPRCLACVPQRRSGQTTVETRSCWAACALRSPTAALGEGAVELPAGAAACRGWGLAWHGQACHARSAACRPKPLHGMPMTRAMHRRETQHFMHYHMTDQATCLLTADGQLAVDFIGRVRCGFFGSSTGCSQAWCAEWHGMTCHNRAWMIRHDMGLLPCLASRPMH